MSKKKSKRGRRPKWSRERIIHQLRDLHRRGISISYSAMSQRYQPLVSAAVYHFGSYRDAVERAEIHYPDVTARPRWTKQRIIIAIKQARRAGRALNWAAVTRRRDALSRVAFASLQPRLFGAWDRALHAAGLDADDVSHYRKWTKHLVIFELRARVADGEALNSAAVQQEDAALHAAAVRYFKGFDSALAAAKLDSSTIRIRQRWSRARLISAIRKFKNGKWKSRDAGNLKRAVIREFGSWNAALRASARRSR